MRGIPLALLVTDALGTVLTAVGFAGLLTDLSRLAPALGDKNFAGMLAGVGCALMTFSMLRIVRILRAQRATTKAGSDR